MIPIAILIALTTLSDDNSAEAEVTGRGSNVMQRGQRYATPHNRIHTRRPKSGTPQQTVIPNKDTNPVRPTAATTTAATGDTSGASASGTSSTTGDTHPAIPPIIRIAKALVKEIAKKQGKAAGEDLIRRVRLWLSRYRNTTQLTTHSNGYKAVPEHNVHNTEREIIKYGNNDYVGPDDPVSELKGWLQSMQPKASYITGRLAASEEHAFSTTGEKNGALHFSNRSKAQAMRRGIDADNSHFGGQEPYEEDFVPRELEGYDVDDFVPEEFLPEERPLVDFKTNGKTPTHITLTDNTYRTNVVKNVGDGVKSTGFSILGAAVAEEVIQVLDPKHEWQRDVRAGVTGAGAGAIGVTTGALVTTGAAAASIVLLPATVGASVAYIGAGRAAEAAYDNVLKDGGSKEEAKMVGGVTGGAVGGGIAATATAATTVVMSSAASVYGGATMFAALETAGTLVGGPVGFLVGLGAATVIGAGMGLFFSWVS